MVIDGFAAWLLIFVGYTAICGAPMTIVTAKALREKLRSPAALYGASFTSAYLPIILFIGGAILCKQFSSFEGVYFWVPIFTLGAVSVFLRIYLDLKTGASKFIPLYNGHQP